MSLLVTILWNVKTFFIYELIDFSLFNDAVSVSG
jgi:hypothetical protein